MFDFLEGYDLWEAFWTTVQLTVLSAVGSLIWGTLLAAMRVGPVPLMRGFGTAYVNIVRNIPLTVIILFASLGLNQTSSASRSALRPDRHHELPARGARSDRVHLGVRV